MSCFLDFWMIKVIHKCVSNQPRSFSLKFGHLVEDNSRACVCMFSSLYCSSLKQITKLGNTCRDVSGLYYHMCISLSAKLVYVWWLREREREGASGSWRACECLCARTQPLTTPLSWKEPVHSRCASSSVHTQCSLGAGYR